MSSVSVIEGGGDLPCFQENSSAVVPLKSEVYEQSSVSYWAIYRLPAFGKVFERIMLQRLGLEVSHPMSDKE